MVAEVVGGLIGPAKKGGANAPPRVVNGTTVFQPEKTTAFFFPDDTRAFLIGGAEGPDLPVEEAVAAARANAGKLKGVREMAALIGTVDTKLPLWGATVMTDTFRKVPFLAPFDSITLQGKPEGGKLALRLEGKGNDADKVKAAVEQINAGLEMGRQQMKEDPKFMPPEMLPIYRLAKDFVGTLSCTADGKDAALTGSIRDTGETLGILLLFVAPGRISVEPPQPAPALPIAPPPPVPVPPG